MTRIAVYEKFYKDEKRPDAVGEALQGLDCSVTSANTIRGAVEQILAFKEQDRADQPDIVIIGGMLWDDAEYKRHPYAVEEPLYLTGRKLFGGEKLVERKRTTFMLPKFGPDYVEYRFPRVVTRPNVNPDAPQGLVTSWEPFMSVAGPIVSRVVETYLPDAVRIGISSDLMLDSVLDAEVRRSVNAIQELRDHIEHYS